MARNGTTIALLALVQSGCAGSIEGDWSGEAVWVDSDGAQPVAYELSADGSGTFSGEIPDIATFGGTVEWERTGGGEFSIHETCDYIELDSGGLGATCEGSDWRCKRDGSDLNCTTEGGSMTLKRD